MKQKEQPGNRPGFSNPEPTPSDTLLCVSEALLTGEQVPILRLWGTFLIQTTTEEEGKGIPLHRQGHISVESHKVAFSQQQPSILASWFFLGGEGGSPQASTVGHHELTQSRWYRMSAVFQLTHARSPHQCHVVLLFPTQGVVAFEPGMEKGPCLSVASPLA